MTDRQTHTCTLPPSLPPLPSLCASQSLACYLQLPRSFPPSLLLPSDALWLACALTRTKSARQSNLRANSLSPACPLDTPLVSCTLLACVHLLGLPHSHLLLFSSNWCLCPYCLASFFSACSLKLFFSSSLAQSFGHSVFSHT